MNHNFPQTKIDGFHVYYQHKEELIGLKREIFAQHCYYFATDNPSPTIIDAGAHIGLATLYFKKQWPAARITAIEPHPVNFALLTENVWANGLRDVTCLNVALAEQAGHQQFYVDQQGSWLSTGSFRPNAWNGQQKTEPIEVETMTLSSLLTEPIDLVKLDIEGAELAVLKEASDQIHFVNRLLIECHPSKNNPTNEIIELLRDHNFKLKFLRNGGQVSEKQALQGLVTIEADQQR